MINKVIQSMLQVFSLTIWISFQQSETKLYKVCSRYSHLQFEYPFNNEKQSYTNYASGILTNDSNILLTRRNEAHIHKWDENKLWYYQVFFDTLKSIKERRIRYDILRYSLIPSNLKNRREYVMKFTGTLWINQRNKDTYGVFRYSRNMSNQPRNKDTYGVFKYSTNMSNGQWLHVILTRLQWFDSISDKL